MSTLFSPQAPVLAATTLGEDFPVRRVFCVGRNYAAHAREMGRDPDREPPFFFTKPADAIVADGSRVPYPPATANLHHEIELVVAIGRGGADIAAGQALGHVFGYAAGIDLTRRDLQNAAKAVGQPWDMSKGFDLSAPIGTIRPVAETGHPERAGIRLSVNGTLRQNGTIATLSRLVTLAAGDLIYTGTPEGVGPLVPGDHVTGEIDGIGTITIAIV